MDLNDIVLILSIIIGYLLGSINFAVIIGTIFYKTDVRQHGSGNAGASNTLRTLGKKAAIFTTIGDLAKGIIACLIGMLIFKGNYPNLGLILAGSAAILGHNWPIFFQFKGGKGVLTSLGVMLMVAPIPSLICLGFFIIIVLATRFISLGSIVAAAILPFLVFFLGDMLGSESGLNATTYFSIFIAILLIYRHKANILRLIKGTESKLGSIKK